jgi:hypothetical protein
MAAMAVSWCARNFTDDANTIVFFFSSLWFAAGISMMLLMLEDLVMEMRMSCMDEGGVVEDSAVGVFTFRK